MFKHDVHRPGKGRLPIRWLGVRRPTTALLVALTAVVASARRPVTLWLPSGAAKRCSGEPGKVYTADRWLGFTAANANGGINGVPVRLVTVDDAYKPEETVRLARELLSKESPSPSLRHRRHSQCRRADQGRRIDRERRTAGGVRSSGAGSVIGRPACTAPRRATPTR